MSSYTARYVINEAVTAAANPLPVFDLSDYVSFEDCLSQIDSQAVLVQYVASDETIQSIGGEGNQCWEETGSVVIHFIVPTGFDSDPVVQICDGLRYSLRGKRLSKEITIENMSPFTDFGVGEGVNGAWHGWASNLYYVRRLHGEGEGPIPPGTSYIRIIGTGDTRITGDGDTRIIKRVA